MNPIKDMLTGNDNSYSLVKVIAFFVILVILGEHFYMTVHTGEAQPMDWTTIMAIVGSLGAAVAHSVTDDKPLPLPPPK